MLTKTLLISFSILSLLITGSSAPQMQKLSDLSKKEGWVFLAYDRFGNKTYYIRNGRVELIYPKTDVIKELGLNVVVELGYTATPALSPDENLIAYIRRFSASTRDQAITIYNLRDKTSQDLITSTKDIYALYWSPTGKEIAFIAKDDYKNNYASRLYTVDVQSRQISELNPGENSASMSWAPDGKEFVVSSDRGLSILNQETKSRRKIDEGGVMPSWSPNGEVISYFGNYFEAGGRKNCYTIKPDGSNKQTLFSHKEFISSEQGFIGKIVWSPDMKYVIYHRTAGIEGYQQKTYLLDLRTKERKEIHPESELGIVVWRLANRK